MKLREMVLVLNGWAGAKLFWQPCDARLRFLFAAGFIGFRCEYEY